eukprot:10294868-Heterocapsa_arctica.AAC.1
MTCGYDRAVRARSGGNDPATGSVDSSGLRNDGTPATAILARGPWTRWPHGGPTAAAAITGS